MHGLTPTTSSPTPTKIPPSPAATAILTPTSSPVSIAQELPAVLAHYSFVVELNYPGRALKVSQRIDVRNNSPDHWETLVLHAPANRLPGAFSLENMLSSDTASMALPFTYDEVTLTYTLLLPSRLPPGESMALQLDYALAVPPTSYNDWPPTGDFGYSEQIMQLGNWYPVLVPYVPGAGWSTWRYIEIGDPYVTEVAVYDLSVHASQGLVVAAGGERTDLPEGWRFQFDSARAIAFSVSPNYRVLCDVAGAISVCSYYLPEHVSAGEDVLQAAIQAIPLFSRLYGPYPYSSLVIAEDAFFGSMEYTGFILHSGAGYARYEGRPDSMLIALTAHEVAHQWWYSLVGSDQVNEPWIDEALAMYSELAFYREYHPGLENWFWASRVGVYRPSGPLDRSIYDFPDSQTYIQQLYRRGVQFLDELAAAMGHDAFSAFLQEFRERGANRIVTTDQFFELLVRHDGGRATSIVDSFFSDPARYAQRTPTP